MVYNEHYITVYGLQANSNKIMQSQDNQNNNKMSE